MEKGTLSGNPISGVRFVVTDGGFHIVDSSELAFRNATIGAFRETYKLANAIVLEPIMKVEVVAPSEFQSETICCSIVPTNQPARQRDWWTKYTPWHNHRQRSTRR
jgi:translation elongation factor EF-G